MIHVLTLNRSRDGFAPVSVSSFRRTRGGLQSRRRSQAIRAFTSSWRMTSARMMVTTGLRLVTTLERLEPMN